MLSKVSTVLEKTPHRKSAPVVSAVLRDGEIVEMVYDPKERRTRLVLWQDHAWQFRDALSVNPLHELVPYSPQNNLIKSGVVLFPSEPEEYGSEDDLLQEIQSFIHRYTDLSLFFEKIASYYALFTWVYDGFNELPYLRVKGDAGSGKTRFLLTVGSLCYKPIFASGASTVSPLFRILDAFRGTLILDESDFRFSDEKAEIIKILNNGNARGFPVLRSDVLKNGEYSPRAYQVFGPKLVATRGGFDDRAVESRFLTEVMGQFELREDVPINLPATHREEALHLRNKLLLFRFRNFRKRSVAESLVDRRIEPRLNQIFVPLLSIIEEPKAREELHEVMRSYHLELIAERGMDTEAQLLEVIKGMLSMPDSPKLSISEITKRFTDTYGEEYERKITSKWVGGILRRKLHLKTQKSHGVFVIPTNELPKLKRLYNKFGVTDDGTPDPNPLTG